MGDLLERVRSLADDVLFPAAIDVDRTGAVPEAHWKRLADDGLYGLAAPPDVGGPGLDLPEIIEILETMASGCLATTFTWMQHHGVVLGLSTSPNAELRATLLGDLARGQIRGGVAFAGVIPDPPRMRAVRVEGGWRLTGDGPFVSGWDIIDVLQISAGDVDSGDVIAGIIDAHHQPGITSIDRLPLVAADATNTVALRLDDLFVPDERVTNRVPRTGFLANQIFGARLNGTLPLGLVRRATSLLAEAGHHDIADRFRTRCDTVRGRLDAGLAEPTAMLPARADAAQLALHAAAALVTAGGGPSLTRTNHAQRLTREAMFTLVAASRPELKAALLKAFAPS